MQALIGSNGAIGQSLLAQCHFDAVFNSDNLNHIQNHSWDRIICAAPSGNRLAINREQIADQKDCKHIVEILRGCQVQQLILISSVDAVTAADSIYGHNRAVLENELSQIHPTWILRLPTLIGKTIKKNILFDLHHGLFLDHLDLGAELQWCCLDDLSAQIDISLASPPGARNIVSEPIKNWEIVERFFPELIRAINPSTVKYNQQPWTYTKQQIFAAMEQYLK